MHRRGFLALAGVGQFAGCLGGMPKDAVVSLERRSTAGEGTVTRFRDLPEAEKDIVRTALSEGFYHACPEIPDAVRSFAKRIAGPEPYLSYQDQHYGLYVRVEDLDYASTAPPPDNVPDCGIL